MVGVISGTIFSRASVRNPLSLVIREMNLARLSRTGKATFQTEATSKPVFFIGFPN